MLNTDQPVANLISTITDPEEFLVLIMNGQIGNPDDMRLRFDAAKALMIVKGRREAAGVYRSKNSPGKGESLANESEKLLKQGKWSKLLNYRYGPIKFEHFVCFDVVSSWKKKTQGIKHWGNCTSDESKWFGCINRASR